jgi:AraC-like DNA-binding protein
LTSPQRPLLTQTAANARRVNLTLKRGMVRRHLMALLHDEPARAPAFALALDLTLPRMRAYLGYLWGVVAALEQDGGFIDQPLVGRAVEEALVAGLLLAQPHDYSDRLDTKPAPAPGSVKRTLDYMEAHLEADITLADLAAIAQVPARTLQLHFRARFGCGPMDYLRGRRLCQARAELARGDSTVTTVALRWGFGSLGRFAGAYRARFGESPSQTLRGARR